MEIFFCVIAFALVLIFLLAVFLVALVYRVGRRLPRPIVLLFLFLAAIESGIWFIAPQFPRRIATALNANIAETSPAPEFAELRTRVYGASPDRVLEAVSSVVTSRPGKWSLVSADRAEGRIHATTQVLVFTDDIFVHVQSEGAGTRVDVRSQSRVGKGDFGENRRHVAWLLEKLDRRLAGHGN